MTRLITDWIEDISKNIEKSEKELIKKTGLSYVELASIASNISKQKIQLASKNLKIGVIPVTTGQGIISTFSESVAAILRYMNFNVHITSNTDVAGIYEAYQKNIKIIFLADDDRFIAVNLEKNIIAENSIATAKGFVAAMKGAVGNLKEKEILVVGCGLVGEEMLKILLKEKANPIAYDINREKLKKIEEKGYKVIYNLDNLRDYKLILDATNNGGWINKNMLNPKVFIASPGVPISLDKEAYDTYKDKIVHDYLPIGVATMVAIACGQDSYVE